MEESHVSSPEAATWHLPKALAVYKVEKNIMVEAGVELMTSGTSSTQL